VKTNPVHPKRKFKEKSKLKEKKLDSKEKKLEGNSIEAGMVTTKRLRFPLFPSSEGCLRRRVPEDDSEGERWGEVPVKGRVVYESSGTINPQISEYAFPYNNTPQGSQHDFAYDENDIPIKRTFNVSTCGHLIHEHCYLEVVVFSFLC
jgi:hypothetical protein